MMKSSYKFNVDLTNPGQFFACCGLLELANAVDADALGWFEPGAFCIDGAAAAESLIDRFTQCIATAAIPSATNAEDDEAESAEKSPPLDLGEPFGLRLDWWDDRTAVRAGFKTWGGGQTVLGFFDGMRDRIREADLPDADLLVRALPINTPRPFSFDSRLSVLTLIDLGFFPDKSPPTFSPAAEALTLVGLQRFRPATIELREQYAYSIWCEPLPASVASAVAAGLTPTLADTTYQFPFVIRTGGKYKAFGPALPKRSLTHA